MALVRRRGAVVRVGLEADERALLSSLAGQLVALLESFADASADPLERLVGMADAPVEPPTDPVTRRLLPDAYRDDPELAAEFRRLTDSELRDIKATALRRIVTDVDEGNARLDLDEDAVELWLHALTDLRLALGTRLDVSEDIDEQRARLSPDDPQAAEFAIYDWLSWLQEAMLAAVMGD